jgi:excisionase family DNA binding protein
VGLPGTNIDEASCDINTAVGIINDIRLKKRSRKEMPMTQKHVGTVEEAAEVLQISRNSAYEAVKEGQIPSIRVGRRILVLWRPFMRKIGAEVEKTA